MNSELREKLEKAFESARYTDYGYNGEDEYPIDAFDEDFAINEVIWIINQERSNQLKALIDRLQQEIGYNENEPGDYTAGVVSAYENMIDILQEELKKVLES